MRSSQICSTNGTTSAAAKIPATTPRYALTPSTCRFFRTSVSTWEELESALPSESDPKPARPPPPPSKHLYIARLRRNVTKDEIRQVIREVGGIDDFDVRLGVSIQAAPC